MNHFTRRNFLQTSALAGAASSIITPGMLTGSEPATPFPMGKAEHCIMIWLGGGACHVDTWDPKKKGDAKARKPGSYYDCHRHSR